MAHESNYQWRRSLIGWRCHCWQTHAYSVTKWGLTMNQAKNNARKALQRG